MPKTTNETSWFEVQGDTKEVTLRWFQPPNPVKVLRFRELDLQAKQASHQSRALSGMTSILETTARSR
jgi:predicted HD phosphohydrolase